MVELVSVIALFLGAPLLIIGGIWSVVRARSAGTRWMLAMILLFPLALPAFCLYDWNKAKKPMLVTFAGFILVLIPFYFSLEQ